MKMLSAMPMRTVQRDRFGRSWAGRPVLVVGLGRSGAAAAELLQRVGCAVSVTDAGTGLRLESMRTTLLQKGIRAVELGKHTKAMVESAELVVLSPGVRETVLPVCWAQERGIAIMSEIELSYHFCPSPIVAVTGSNGKSSTVTLVQNVLAASGKHAVACGNLGVPFAEIVHQLGPESVAVVEVSSFQLSHCFRFKPDVAVVLNLGANHLDRHGTLDAYHRAKSRIFQQQSSEDFLILNADDAQIIRQANRAAARKIWFGRQAPSDNGYSLAAVTKQNLSASDQVALQVARIFRVPDPLSWQVIREFRGLEHRIECVARFRGRTFINDAKSTTPESTLYALDKVRGEKVVILGGRDKGLDFAPLAQQLIRKDIAGVVLMGENSAELYKQCVAAGVLPERIRSVGVLREAVEAAWQLSKVGCSIVLSPAYASYDQFAGFEERGHAFKGIVRAMEAELRASAEISNSVTPRVGS